MPEGSEIKWLRVSVARTRNFMYFQQNENGIFIKTCALLKIYKRFLLTPYSLSLSLPGHSIFGIFSSSSIQGRLFKSIFLLFYIPFTTLSILRFLRFSALKFLSFLFYHPSGIKRISLINTFVYFFLPSSLFSLSFILLFFRVFVVGENSGRFPQQ